MRLFLDQQSQRQQGDLPSQGCLHAAHGPQILVSVGGGGGGMGGSFVRQCHIFQL